MAATIERRLLVNYRVDPNAAEALLPDGLRPQLVNGSAVAGVCLIRLSDFRPTWFSPKAGHRSASAAHRIAVEWDGPDGLRTGVYIPRRHSASRLAQIAGGRVFPGVHEHAKIAARDFFGKDAIGWSPTRAGQLEPLRLDTDAWRVEPGHASRVESSFFDGLPTGSTEFDHVLVMREVPVVWSSPAEIAPDERQAAAISTPSTLLGMRAALSRWCQGTSSSARSSPSVPP